MNGPPAPLERQAINVSQLAEFVSGQYPGRLDRRIIGECLATIERGALKSGTTWNDDAAGAEVGTRILLILASDISGHPDYDPNWAIPEDDS